MKKFELNLNSFIDNIPNYCLVVESSGNILLSNKLVDEIFEQKCIGLTLDDLGLYETAEFVRDHQKQKTDIIETIIIGDELHTIKLHIKFDPEKNYYYIFGADLNEELSTRREIEKIKEQSESAAKFALIGELAAGTAHEINNPLSIISGILHIAKKQINHTQDTGTLNKQKLEEQIDKCIKAGKRISSIVKGLTALARSDKNLDLELYNLVELISENVELCREKNNALGVDIRFNPEASVINFYCNPVQIGQVIINLLVNACDAVSNLPEKWVEIKLYSSEEVITIEVIDSGKGIPKDIAEKIMFPFFTTKVLGKGTGLGLSVSKNIIESHLGTLYIDSQSPNTKFVINFPKANSQLAINKKAA